MRAHTRSSTPTRRTRTPCDGGETPTSGGCWRCTEVTMATLPKLITEVKRDFGTRTRIWLTEYGYNSKPPSKWLGVSNTLQASTSATRPARVPRYTRRLLIHFLVRDEPNALNGRAASTQAGARSSPRSTRTRYRSPRFPAGWITDEHLGPGPSANGPPAVSAAAIASGRWEWSGKTAPDTAPASFGGWSPPPRARLGCGRRATAGTAPL